MAKVYSYKEVVEMSIRAAWSHLMDYHFNLSDQELHERVMTGNLEHARRSRTNIASTFLCTETNLKDFLRHSLLANKEKVMNWLKNSEKGYLTIHFDLDNAPNQCIKGRVYDGNHYYVADDSMIILRRVEGIFTIKTAHPNWRTW